MAKTAELICRFTTRTSFELALYAIDLADKRKITVAEWIREAMQEKAEREYKKPPVIKEGVIEEDASQAERRKEMKKSKEF